MKKTLLELSDISAGYDKKIILKNVNFHVKENDFVGIIGPNGGGKTTLLKLILGLIPPMSGSIRYFFDDNQKKYRNFIGYLPQQNRQDSEFPISVQEVIMSGMISPGKRHPYIKKNQAKLDEVLEITGMKNYKNSPVGDLSGGQLQRVFLGRAIISEPSLLILDEPDTFVDNRFENELYQLLKDLNEKLAILLVSHDVGTISSYIKTIACVNSELHYHPSNEISSEQLKIYNCPIDIITHGQVPHRVLPEHDHPPKKEL